MALRAFHCNPSLGGFGNETETNHPNLNLNPHSNRKSSSKTSSGGSNSNSSPLYPKASESGDAFAQIVKELVDNAVDACSTSYDKDSAAYTSRMNRSASKSSSASATASATASASASKCPPPPPLKRVRVSLERVKSKNSNEEENMEQLQQAQQQRRDLLRLTISDTGCGMQDIEKYVSAFSSSKIHDDDDPQKNPKTKTNADGNGNGNAGADSDSLLSKNLSKETAGRYGVGLTLCLIHAQRLVPNTCAIIKSTIEGSSSWTVAKFVVDTHRDCVVCVEKKILRKGDNSMSGTGISLMLPVSKDDLSVLIIALHCIVCIEIHVSNDLHGMHPDLNFNIYKIYYNIMHTSREERKPKELGLDLLNTLPDSNSVLDSNVASKLWRLRYRDCLYLSGPSMKWSIKRDSGDKKLSSVIVSVSVSVRTNVVVYMHMWRKAHVYHRIQTMRRAPSMLPRIYSLLLL